MMKIIPTLSAGALAMMALGLGTPSVAYAQAEATISYLGGRAATASCPVLEWRLLPMPPGAATVNGVAYWSDMSGISTIKGTSDASGKVTATLTSVAGKGPAGTVTGQRELSVTRVEMRGNTACDNVKLEIHRWVPGSAALSGGD